ncbi:hypothetical protein HU200_010899 [Digitaria exilis]|uniref:Uncharacterized protein n=1 Tax=Digitaria exilis TaxID=1010633 RepID=A0A835FH35_9POAL|nr:hypothetical protein HU200_010899 [Digitaria exilis]CAB3497602.1 unnamed protein product [Digitaria exilis]
MGSLMSGWSSSVLSDKEVRLMRNRSLTKEEVEAFWRQHGRSPAENGDRSHKEKEKEKEKETIPPLAARRLQVVRSMPPLRGGTRRDDEPSSPSPRGGQQAQSLFSPRSEPCSPATNREQSLSCFFPENAADTSTSTSNGWWTRSSWAFLNEAPKDKEEVVLGMGRAQRQRQRQGFACDQFHASRILTGNA